MVEDVEDRKEICDMFVIMVDICVDKGYFYVDYMSEEYSGVRHTTRDDAEKELDELIAHNIDNEMLRHAYIVEL